MGLDQNAHNGPVWSWSIVLAISHTRIKNKTQFSPTIAMINGKGLTVKCYQICIAICTWSRKCGPFITYVLCIQVPLSWEQANNMSHDQAAPQGVV